MQHLLSGLLLGAFAMTAQAAIVGEEVSYRAGDTEMKGYLAYDNAIKGQRPGVLVIPEWWGANDYVKRRARMLAALGYAALVVDMYGGGQVVERPDAALALAKTIYGNPALRRERFTAARDLLERQPTVEREHLAAIGYCFGGAVLLGMARDGMKLDGIVSFHGGLGTEAPAQPGAIHTPLLVLAGGDDRSVPPEMVETFRQEMTAARADFQLIVYPGATHAFTNPAATETGRKFQMPIAYNEQADHASWAEMERFLAQVFAQ